MSDLTFRWTIVTDGGSLTYSKTYTGTADVILDESVPDSSTDLLMNVAIDVSAVKAFMIVSDYAVLIETNSGSAPGNSLTLVANHPYMWDTDSEETFLLTVDVTKIYVTNASGSAAALKIRCTYDATPP